MEEELFLINLLFVCLYKWHILFIYIIPSEYLKLESLMNLREPILNHLVINPMELALQLAERGRYSVSPNPMVGAVLILDKKLVGYGYHLYQGDQHAESKAIDMAGTKCKGASLYLNLEPCSHYGLTPPCVNKIINAGIAEVHFSSIDPNPLINGKSVSILQQAGIKVIIGELKEEAEELNEIFYHYMQNKKPFVIAKWAMTIDGKIATKEDSKWITNEASREHAHYLRNSVDAILIGANTALKDNPTLNVRSTNLPHIRHPYKFILTNQDLPANSNLFSLNPEKTYIIHSGETNHILADMGVNFLKVRKLANGDFDLNELLNKMAELSITSLLVEGGGFTHSKFLQANLINKFYCYISPKFVGGDDSISPFSQDIGINYIKDAKQAKFTRIEKLDGDILLQGRF